MPTGHHTAAEWLAERRQAAASVEAKPPQMVALPGALTPIPVDRLEAHQADGLSMHEIVEYENQRHREAHPEIEQRRAQWCNGRYAAQVQVHREIEAEKRRHDAEAAAAYQRRLAEILAEKDAHQVEADQIREEG